MTILAYIIVLPESLQSSLKLYKMQYFGFYSAKNVIYGAYQIFLPYFLMLQEVMPLIFIICFLYLDSYYNVCMQKILILIFFFFLSVLSAYADYFPSYVNPLYHYGIGVAALKGEVPVYELDDVKSNLAAYVKNDEKGLVIRERGVNKSFADEMFLLYKAEGALAFLSVEEDTDDWYYVCFDQKRKLFGWVRKSENIDFMSWHDFFNVYGRKNGIYIFRNVKDSDKKLYSAPDKESTVVDDFYFAKHIALWLIGGDWMLVKVTTYDGLTKTGWMRWRLDDGSIIAFPDFKQ